MKARMITGFLLCAMLGIFLFWLRGYSLYIVDVLVLFFMIGSGIEMCKAYRHADDKTATVGTEIDGVIIVDGAQKKVNTMLYVPVIFALLSFGFFVWLGSAGILIALILTSIMVLTVFTFNHKYSLTDFVATMSTMLYPQLFLAMFYVLNHKAYGLLAIVLVLCISICTDSMALGFGMLFGKHKLCPSISPKKTIEGAVGGFVGGILGSFLAFVLFDILHLFDYMGNVGALTLGDYALYVRIILYALIGIFGSFANQIGDLGASWIKRNVGIKDYSKIFPGHGGIMDRLDGISFVMGMVYVITAIIF